MGKRLIVATCLVLAACSKAPDAGDTPDFSGNASAGIAFAYGYSFELPSRVIADLQEKHAQACEQAGLAACRITGLSYRVDRDGQAHASLSVKVAAGVARRFGRNAVMAADAFGATLVGAEITGEEVQTAASEAEQARRTAGADVAQADRTLKDPRLSSAERAQVRAQREARVAAERDGATAAAAQAERLANTPMSFSYQAGHGVGFANALRDSADTALSSTRATLIGATWLLATVGPPAILLLLLWLAWRPMGTAALVSAGRRPRLIAPLAPIPYRRRISRPGPALSAAGAPHLRGTCRWLAAARSTRARPRSSTKAPNRAR